MKRDFTFKGVNFYVANCTPRKNEFERGLKYALCVEYDRRGNVSHLAQVGRFETIRQAKDYAEKNYFCWL